MGTDLLDLSDAKDKFTQAETFLGWSVAEICQRVKISYPFYFIRSRVFYVVESVAADLIRDRDGYQPR